MPLAGTVRIGLARSRSSPAVLIGKTRSHPRWGRPKSTSRDPSLDDFTLSGIRRPHRQGTARAGLRVVAMSIGAGHSGALAHVLPAADVVLAIIVEADIEELGTPGRLRGSPPFHHFHPAVGANRFVFSHSLLPSWGRQALAAGNRLPSVLA